MVSLVNSANYNFTGAQAFSLFTGATGDLHIIRVAARSLSTNVPPLPSGYTYAPNSPQRNGAFTVGYVAGRVLQGGDVAPSLNPGGVSCQGSSEVYEDQLVGTALDAMWGCTLSVNSSASAMAYVGLTPVHAGVVLALWGVYNTSGAGVFGTPTTLPGADNPVVNQVGANMRSTLWTLEQLVAATIASGNIPITGGSSQTNRGMLLAIRPSLSTSVTIASAGDELYYDNETDIPLIGTAFGATHTLAADVIVSPTDDVDDVDAVVQTIQSWSATSIVWTADLATFDAFTDLFLFVKDSAGVSNAAGFVIQRQLRFRLSLTLRDRGDGDDAAVNWVSKAGIEWSVHVNSIRSAAVLDGDGGETDAAALFLTPYYLLTDGGPVEDGDYVFLSAVLDDATPANVRATLVKVLPTYE